MVRVALGCRQTTRCGVKAEGMGGIDYTDCRDGRNKGVRSTSAAAKNALTALRMTTQNNNECKLKPNPVNTIKRLNYIRRESETGMYSPRLLDHFEHPRNAGALAEADARVRVENPACGDIVELAVKVETGNCLQGDSISCEGMRSGNGLRVVDY